MISEKARAMREELRNGRNNKASGAGQDSIPNGGSDDFAGGTTLQNAGRSTSVVESIDNRHETGSTPGHGGTTTDKRDSGNDQRSPKRSIIRSRRGRGRSREGDLGTAPSPTTTEPIQSTTIGNIEATGPLPARLPDQPIEELPEPRKRDRRGYISPSRQAAKTARENSKLEQVPLVEKKVPFLPQGKKLSATEAETLSTPFSDSIEDYCKYMDQYLWSRETKAGKPSGERPVWSNLDDEELAAFTRVMMRTGQKNQLAAAAVRGVVESRDYLIAAMIFGPRIAITRQIIADTQIEKPPRDALSWVE